MRYYDAIIIRFTDDDGCVHNIIVDGGDIKSTKYCYTDKLKRKLHTLFSNGESIDLWIISHIDNDHIGGLYNFINDSEFFATHYEKLKEVWMNYGGAGDYEVQKSGNVGYHDGKKLRDVLHERNICVKEGIVAGVNKNVSNTAITVIAPDTDSYQRYIEWWNNQEFHGNVETSDGFVCGGDWDYDIRFLDFDLNRYEEDEEVKNNSSIAFVLTYHNTRILFSTDSCSSILTKGLNGANIVKDGKAHFDLVHIPHHGSCRNSSFCFLDSIVCHKHVITGNGTNRYHLPDKETIARLIAANPSGCMIHFPEMNDKLQEIFEEEGCSKIEVSNGTIFVYE